jgi:2-polyprenyl-3-methyl-5-hydroxy-6-metoxy-1,4-benzoquinol methylase
MLVKLDSCPLCKSTSKENYLEVKDFNVTQESFQLQKCTNCDLIFTNNIPDESNIGKYYKFENYVSHTDTSKSLFFKVYHFVRSLMLVIKYNWISQYNLQRKRALDIGSGTGAFLAFLRKKGWDITGIEVDDVARANALRINNIDSLPPSDFYKINNQEYDVITLWHVLEHLHDLEGYLKKIKSILAKDGILLIAVPNPTSVDANYYKEFWGALDVPRHLYHFTPKSMDWLAQSFGFEIISKKRMWFDSIYASILSEKYKNGLSFRGVLIGLFSNISALFNKNNCSSLTYILKHQDNMI